MNELIKAFLDYGKNHLGLSNHETESAQRQLSERLKLMVSLETSLPTSASETLASLKKKFHDAMSLKVDPQSLEYENTWVDCLGYITASTDTFQRSFWAKYAQHANDAMQWWHALQMNNDYIKASLTQQNITFRHPIGVHEIECTINLAKPEKRNEDIAKILQQPQVTTHGPACVICRENLGYAGSSSSPSKMNMRIVDLKLGKHDWFMQYSPYAYFPFHLIAVDRIHRPMEISDYSIGRLFDFLDQFPHLFIGSNSDLPIVGGSILNHEHFQGGDYAMPLFTASVAKSIASPWSDVLIDQLSWFNNVIRFQSSHRQSIERALNHLQSFWRHYSDESVDLISKTTAQHNTLTIITRTQEKQFIAYVVLRNNRVNKTYPQGIFHAHPEYHGIKKEGIGLIESLGLMVLPARLKREFETLKQAALKREPCPIELNYHQPLFEQLKKVQPKQYDLTIERYACSVSAAILDNTAIFKTTPEGQNAYQRFILSWLPK
jgi:UDPglucose--hexose-1-phosphate uridylyltransferase